MSGPGEPDRFDLDRFDEAYFQRLRRFVAEASKRGIVVEYVLFCPFYEDSMWDVSPMNGRNNVNQVAMCGREEALTLKHQTLVDRQLAFVRKVVADLNGFDNLIFEICNEPYFGGVGREWQAKVAATIVETEKGLANKHLIAENVANGRASIKPVHPAVGLFNFHYAFPPDVIELNPTIKAAIGDDETGFRGTGDRAYRTEAWDFLLAGGSLYDNLDYSFTTDHPDGTAEVRDPTPGGGGPVLRGQLATLKRFLNGFDFLHMAPDRSVIRQSELGEKATVRALSRPGEQYAIYVNGGPKARLTLDLPRGRYRFAWIDPKTGSSLDTGTLNAGAETVVTAPAFEEDIALKILVDREVKKEKTGQ